MITTSFVTPNVTPLPSANTQTVKIIQQFKDVFWSSGDDHLPLLKYTILLGFALYAYNTHKRIMRIFAAVECCPFVTPRGLSTKFINFISRPIENIRTRILHSFFINNFNPALNASGGTCGIEDSYQDQKL